MTTTRDILIMCTTEYFKAIAKWSKWENDVTAANMAVIAFDNVARGDY